MKSYVRALAALVALVCAPAAHATLITYSATNVADATWRFDYSIANDTLSSPIEEVTIYFGLGLFSNLQVSGSPLTWDSIVIQPDELIPSDGFFDSLALDRALSPGDTLSGFSVLFDFLGTGTPGSQRFEVVNPTSFLVIDSGVTSAPPTAVPEPSSLALLFLGLLAASFLRRKRLKHECRINPDTGAGSSRLAALRCGA
jgi:hypothetical protein